jgi:hypothetical protein
MPSEPVRFGIQESGQTTMAGAAAVAINVIVDARGAVYRRPGIRAATNLTPDVVDSAGVIGLYQPQDGLTDMLAVGNGARRKIYRLTASGAPSLSEGMGANLDDLTGTGRPVFAETEAMVAIAGGMDIQRVFNASFPAVNPPYFSARLGGSPPHASHVLSNQERLLANNTDLGSRDAVQWSGLAAGSSYAGHEDWTSGAGTGGTFFGESRPDPNNAIAETAANIMVFGKTTTELWAPDPSQVYAFVASRDYGNVATYGIARGDSTFAWMDQKRRIVVSDGRTFQTVSDPIQRTLDGLAKVDDCFAYRVTLGPVDGFAFTFPTDGRTFFMQVGGGWSQWHGMTASVFTLFPVLSHFRRVDNGENVVGLTNGKIGALSLDAFDDMGSTLEASVTSGFQDHGTDALKHCKALNLIFARPSLTGTSTATVFVSYRDGEGAWSDPITHKFTAYDQSPEVPLRSLGTYRRRDWRVQWGDGQDVRLVSATEEFTVLSH